ncbi:hypothetical protein BEP19_06985 [Ammoniphilus oxalaticus]|uniref:PPM-type phosphatase domain-containing protein n=1 Tax=Ammoniphilus oxalaticus TaxID=66863 RepID=A0A419SJM3_9BACL|nr:Stp1/IreP family PP2C-type Ser/Thr phosphatase [Ammoniphilus oxalaticus]RKD24146.1 hypothetical protein BEP19_06985 [Ammoniphilus oxalaticus]
MDAAYKTHIGCVRALNEDTGAVVHLSEGHLMAIVADGMGGHKAGDVASLMAVDIIKMELQGTELTSSLTPEAGIDLLDRAILKANDAIFEYANSNDDCHGMGTTVVVSLLNPEWLVIGHIGDSRIYRIAGEEIKQLTEDHSLVNELLKNGQITREEAIHHPQRNVLVKALGTDRSVDVELKALAWDPEDKLLLCSDGLSNKVPPQAMLQTIQQSTTPDSAVEHLIHLALQAGGEDNATAIVIANSKASQERNGVSE